MIRPEDWRFGSADRALAPSASSPQAVSPVPASIPSAVKVMTLRDVMRNVPQSWRAQYGHGHYAKDPDKQAIQRKLDRLDVDTCTPDEIAAIIGNRSWTENRCDVCGAQECDVTAYIGEEPDYEARWQNICLPCLASLGAWAASAIEARRAETQGGSVHESAVPQADARKDVA